MGGLQFPLLGQTFSFAVQEGEAVQILHSGGNHWITASTVGVTHPRLRIYDSPHRDLPFSTKQQIAALLATEEEIILEYANVQVSWTGYKYICVYVHTECILSLSFLLSLYRCSPMAMTAAYLLWHLHWPFVVDKLLKILSSK